MQSILIGGGAFGREIMCWAEHAAETGRFQLPTAYVDDAGPSLDGFDYGLQYAGTIASLRLEPGDQILISIADPAVRARIVATLPSGVTTPALVHPTCTVARTATLGEGVILGPNSYVAADAKVGRFCMINSLVGIGHDAVIGDFTTISSQVDVMGAASVGEGAFVGSGSRILPGVRIGENAKVGAGAVVVRSVKPGTTVFAPPARTL